MSCCKDKAVIEPFFPATPHRLQIMRDKEKTQNSFGSFDPEDPEQIAVRWASIEPLRGRELFQSEMTQAIVSHKVTMRYWKPLAPDMWFLFRERRLNIVSVVNVNEANEKHEVMCLEEQ